MWSEFEARIEENETDRPVPLRRALFEIIRRSELRPGQGVTKKMVSFEFGRTERLLWEIQSPARNVFLSKRWQQRVEDAGFACELRPYQKGVKDGGRHSALSREWSFGDADCVVLRVDTAEEMRRLLDLLLQSGAELTLDPAVVARWITQLRHFFPAFDRFDTPDPDFDDRERSYKLEVASELRLALEKAISDQEITDAIHSALAKSNLLPWRAYWPMSPKGDADRERLCPALRVLANAALGDPSGHAEALDAFCRTWVETAPQGKPDPARQIAEFLFLHLAPSDGIYIRHSVRQDFWLEAVGSRFPDHASMAETYRDELRFMQAVRSAFEENGLAPRDMIDVQSALWVVHNYKDEEDGDAISPLLKRETIEAAMDAYDRFRKTGEHGEVFNSSGEPRDYWVRSTRQRPNQVYPTKPLIGFIREKTELNGGWGQKGDAAAQLHNSGFIVVNKDNAPVEPPEQYDHLIRDADRIRFCALNYYIEPAREKGEARVSIRAGTLASDLFLGNRMRNVCQALKGGKLQKLADVLPPTQSGANDSTSTTFTFKLFDHEKLPTMETNALNQSQTATNLILYGPPGTGKTFSTSWEAVRLCIGAEAAAALDDDRDALMAEYRRLVNEGRIEFLTFHQSLSYEEFVEGLRPSTGDDDLGGPDETDGGTGFRLKCHEGIFKRISERARLDQGDSGESQRLDRSARVFKVALGRRHVEDDRIRFGLDNDLIHLGWGEDIDWSDERFDEFNEIFSEWRSKKNPDASGHDGNIVCTFSFRTDMQVGDYVVVSDGRDRIQAFGRVAGEYYFDPDATYHPHRRKMEWLWRDDKGTDRSRFYPNGFRRHSVYKLNQSLIDWDTLDEIAFGEDTPLHSGEGRDYVLIIDEINRANISKVFGELITLLEQDKRLGAQNEVRVQLPYSKKRFGVPPNLHIVGTMNTADRSIALLDTALRRRFTFRELMPDPTVLSEHVGGINLRTLLSKINERIEYLFDREHQIGHAYFTGCRSRADVEDVMRHKVIPLLAEYFYEDWAKVAAVLGDGPGMTKKHFLESASLQPPKGMPEDDINGDKLRWSVKADFDFSEFEA